MDKELPWGSRVLFEVGAALDRHAPWLAALCLGAVIAAIAAYRSGRLQAAWTRLLPVLPLLGARLRVYRLTRFYRTVAMLLQGGVPLVSALRMVAGLVDEASRSKLEAAIREVHEGGRLSDALARHALTTSIAQRMLQVGERSGDLGGLLGQAATFHEEELGRWVERTTRMLEPVLMLFIGVLIGAIVVLMYMPIFDLAGTLQ
jgi:general secretion pathway protein F